MFNHFFRNYKLCIIAILYIANTPNLFAQLSCNEPTESGYTLSTNETWIDSKRFDGDVIIPNGITLTITSTAFIEFGSGDHLIVEKGGKLQVNGNPMTTTIQGNSCIGSTWGGIQVEGSLTQSQSAINFNTTDPNHGIAILSGLRLNHATTGLYSRGGKISIFDSRFTDNFRGVFVDHDGHYNGNRSVTFGVSNTIFYTTNNYNRSQAPEYIRTEEVNLRNHSGSLDETVRIIGCLFEDQRTGISQNQKARGVLTYMTDIIIGTPLNITVIPHNNFKNLYKGIETNLSLGIAHGVSIIGNNFDDVFLGTSLYATAIANIEENVYTNIPYSTNPSASWGICVDIAPGIVIEGNSITTGTSSNSFAHGIIANNLSHSTGLQAHIYDNDFYGRFHSATYMENNNSNLSIQCNDYNGRNYADWYVAGGVLSDQGACQSIGPDLQLHQLSRNHFHSNCNNSNSFHLVTGNGVTPIKVTASNNNHAPNSNCSQGLARRYCTSGAENPCQGRGVVVIGDTGGGLDIDNNGGGIKGDVYPFNGDVITTDDVIDIDGIDISDLIGNGSGVWGILHGGGGVGSGIGVGIEIGVGNEFGGDKTPLSQDNLYQTLTGVVQDVGTTFMSDLHYFDVFSNTSDSNEDTGGKDNADNSEPFEDSYGDEDTFIATSFYSRALNRLSSGTDPSTLLVRNNLLTYAKSPDTKEIALSVMIGHEQYDKARILLSDLVTQQSNFADSYEFYDAYIDYRETQSVPIRTNATQRISQLAYTTVDEKAKTLANSFLAGQGLVDNTFQPKPIRVHVGNKQLTNTTPTTLITIVPNPAQQITHIHLADYDNNQETTIHLIDVTGKQIADYVAYSTKTSLDLSEYTNGIYFCQIKQNGILIDTKKLVIMNKQ